MCLNPIPRPNTNRTRQERLTRFYSGKPVPVVATSKVGNKIAANARAFGKDGDSAYIYVPCGYCPECVAAKQHALIQRVQSESKYNHLFFCTLTYDNKHLPHLELQVPRVRTEHGSYVPTQPVKTDGCLQLFYDNPEDIPQDVIDQLNARDREIDDSLAMAFDCLDGLRLGHDTEVQNPLVDPSIIDSVTGEIIDDDYETVRLPYADIHHIQLLMKNLRDNDAADGRELRYICVSELGKANGRPHFHILFIVEKHDDDYEWFNGVYRVKPSVSYNLERRLWQSVFKYWAINVGTRKNPVYEKLFTYRKRFYGQKCYTNFDLHYVDPTKTTDGTSNVAYYVTKYIMKGSARERRRQQFLRLNLDETQYRAAWDTIKCRCTMSKGLGLDARFYTVDKTICEHNPQFSCCDYANYLRDVISSSDDLPPDDLASPPPVVYKVVQRRIMVPNFELAQSIRENLARDAGISPGPIFIDPTGHHRPLSHYYQRFGFIYTDQAFLDIYLNYDDSLDIPHYAWTKDAKDEAFRKHEKRLQVIDCNSTFDTSPALLWGGETNIDDNNHSRVYGF